MSTSWYMRVARRVVDSDTTMFCEPKPGFAEVMDDCARASILLQEVAMLETLFAEHETVPTRLRPQVGVGC